MKKITVKKQKPSDLNEKLQKDIQLYQTIFQFNQISQSNQSAIQIRRLLPNKQETKEKLFKNPSLQCLQCFSTQLDQQTSYSLRDKKKRVISFSLLDCSKLFKQNVQHLPPTKPQTKMQKIVIVNHQGRPQTYFMK